MAFVVVPGLDLVSSVPSRIVTVDIVDPTESARAAGAAVDFILPQDLRAGADGEFLKAGTTRLTLDSNGHGEIRLPAYSDATEPADWVILVKESWSPYAYPIRVPEGETKVSLASLAPLMQMSESVAHLIPVGAAVRSVKTGAQWAATADINGGVLSFDLTTPSGGVAWDRGVLPDATDLDDLNTQDDTGLYGLSPTNTYENSPLPLSESSPGLPSVRGLLFVHLVLAQGGYQEVVLTGTRNRWRRDMLNWHTTPKSGVTGTK